MHVNPAGVAGAGGCGSDNKNATYQHVSDILVCQNIFADHFDW